MAKEFELLFKLQAAIGPNFKNSFQSAKSATQTLDKDLKKLKETSGSIDNFKRLSTQLDNSKSKLADQKKVLAELNQKLRESGDQNGKLTEKIRRQDAAIAKTEEKIRKESKSLEDLRGKLEEAGVSTDNLSKEKQKLAREIEKVDKANEKLKNIGVMQAENQKKIAATKTEFLKTTAAIGAAFTGTIVAMDKAAGALDRVDKLSQKIGFSRKAFQEWDYILGQSGASIEGLQTGMKTLNGRMHEAAKGKGAGAEALKKLNVAAVNTNGTMRKQEEVFNDVVRKLQEMPQGAEKSKLAFELFGKSGLELMPLLNSAGGSVDELRKKAHELGIVMSDEAVDAGVLYGDTMDDLKKTLGGVATQVLTTFMPAIIKGAEKLTKGAAAVSKFAREHPKLIELLGKVAVGLAAAKVGTLGLKLGFLNAKGGVLQIFTAFTKLKSLNLATKLGKFGGLLGGMTGKIGLIVLAIGAVVTVLKAITGNADAVREKIRGIFGEDGVAVFDKFLEIINNISNVIKKAFAGSGSESIKKFFDSFKEGSPVMEAVKKVFNALVQELPPIFAAIGNFAQAILPTLISVMDTVINVVSEIIQAILPIVLDLVSALLPIIRQIAEEVLPILATIINVVAQAVLPLIESILPILINVIETVAKAILPLIEEILPVLTDVINFLIPLITVWADVFSTVLVTSVESVKAVLKGLQDIFQGLIDFITGIFTGDWEKAWGGVVKVFGGIWDTLGALVKAPINGIITLINKAIGGLNKLKVPDWVPVLGGKGINIPEIPLLAKGSMQTPDTFVAGEAGPELITGSKGKRVFTAGQTSGIFGKIKNAYQTAKEVITNPAPKLAVAGAGGGHSVVINSSPVFHIANGNPEEIDAKLRENNERLKREIKNELEDEAEDNRRRRYA